MTKSTIIVTDRNFRITIPEEIRIAEGIKQGDIIEIDVKALRKQENWDCKDYILTEEEKDFVNKDSEKIKSDAIITLSPAATYLRINISGIKFTLKDTNNNEIPDDTLIILSKGDKTLGHSEEIARYEYGDLKRKVTLQNKTPLSYYDELRVYVKDKYGGKGIRPEKIRFYVDLCEMKQQIQWKL